MAMTAKETRHERRERLKEHIRESILEAARAEFIARGYHDASMEAIARRAGYAVGSLYHYFKGKMALYLILHDRLSDAHEASVRAVVASDRSFEEKLAALVREHYELWDVHGPFIMTELLDPPIYNRDQATRVRTSHQRRFVGIFDLIARIMETGMQEGKLRKLPARMHTAALVGLVRSMTMYWEHNRPRPPAAERCSIVLDLFYKGAAGPSISNHTELTQ